MQIQVSGFALGPLGFSDHAGSPTSAAFALGGVQVTAITRDYGDHPIFCCPPPKARRGG